MLAIALSLPARGRPVLRLDDVVMGTPGVAALITDATAEDDRGALPLTRRVRRGVLELAPARSPRGRVTFRYHARAVATDVDGALEGLRHDATGLGGHARHFLALPDGGRRHAIRIAWGTPRCPATTTGAAMSTFGGDQPVTLTAELPALREAAYYWGRPQERRFVDGTLHLRVAWFGAPAFDTDEAAAWAARAFAAERAFFADDDPGLYSVFVRVLAAHGERANGIAQPTSYLAWIGPRTTFARRLKVNIAHEMLHRWLGLRLRLQGPEGSAYWFTEGFTVHFSNLIGFRAGLLTVDELLGSINEIATRHFDNPNAGASSARIRRDFYRDPDVAIVPYTRGALYAAELDAALRDAGGSLDDALRALYRRSTAGPLPADAVRRLVKAELGRAGVARYDAVIVRGEPPDPPADAYGPCFERRPREPAGFTWARAPGVPDDQCRAW